ncbi:MAG: MFS transporter [Candidatus Planktophila sp.]
MSNQSALRQAQRARNSLWVSFLLLGMVSMGWVPRIPEIKDAIGLSNGAFGFTLLGSTFGAVAGAQLAGRYVHTYGSQKVIFVGVFIMPAGLAGMALSTNALSLFLTLFTMGLGYALIDMCYNFQGTVIEKILARRYMSSFHAMWSSGAFLTTIIGGAITRHVSPRVNLLAIAAVSLVAYLIAARFLLPSEVDGHKGEEEHAAKIPLFDKSVIPLWWLGFGLLASLVGEGAASDWAAILLRDEMGYGKGVYASAFASFALAMIISRFLGDRALDYFGPARLVKLGGYLGGAIWGVSMMIAIPLSASHPILALIIVNIGFAAAGLGIGPMFPAFILAASKTPGIAPAVAISRVGVIGIAGFFFGPTVTGVIAEYTSLSIAIMYPVAMLLLSGYLSKAIKSVRK